MSADARPSTCAEPGCTAPCGTVTNRGKVRPDKLCTRHRRAYHARVCKQYRVSTDIPPRQRKPRPVEAPPPVTRHAIDRWAVPDWARATPLLAAPGWDA